MIDYCIGTISHVQEQEIILNVGIMGLVFQVPSAKNFVVGSPITLHTHMHWNTENGPSLFGFVTPLERSIFKIVISCSGIGPKIALAVLGELGAQTFLHAITTSDDQVLSKVSGIGKKKAEQIVVQLKHKVATLLETGVVAGELTDISHFHDISQTLQSLNYSRTEITKAMEYLKKNCTITDSSFDYLLRQALFYLSKQL